MNIVERLRIQEETGFVYLPSDWDFVGYGKAADEIERLQEALEIISCKCKSNCGKDEGNCLYWVARCALPQKDSE